MYLRLESHWFTTTLLVCWWVWRLSTRSLAGLFSHCSCQFLKPNRSTATPTHIFALIKTGAVFQSGETTLCRAEWQFRNGRGPLFAFELAHRDVISINRPTEGDNDLLPGLVSEMFAAICLNNRTTNNKNSSNNNLYSSRFVAGLAWTGSHGTGNKK